MRFFISLIFFFNFSLISAQQGYLDSLVNELEETKSDSIHIRLLLKVGNAISEFDTDSAFYYYNKAISKSEFMLENSKKYDRETITYLYILSLYEKGYAKSYQMEYDIAEETLNKALDYTEHIVKHSEIHYLKGESFKLKADIVSAIGDIYLDKGYYSIALSHYISSTEITDDLIKENLLETSNLAQRYFSIGLVHYYLKNYDKSLEYYLKSKDIAKKYNKEIGVAKCNNNIGIIKTKKGLYDEALKYLDSTLVFAEENQILLLQAQVYDNMADCFIEKKDYKKAELYLAKSIIISQKLKNIQGEIFVMLGLADLYTKIGKYQKALKYADSSNEKAEEIGSVSLKKASFMQLSEIYEKMGQYKNALSYHKKYKELEDSLFNKEKNRQTAEMEAKYQANNKQKEIDLQKLELAKRDAKIIQKRNQNYAYAIVVSLLLIIIAYIFFSYKRKQKRNKVIRTQNKKITDSIEYAKKIQTAALPSEKYLDEILKSYFVLYKPLQIVSGDYYWALKKDQFIALAAADCTGHGVPGAFVSMLGISLLNELSLNFDMTRPDLILEEMRFILKRSFGQTDEYAEQADGIDITLCIIDKLENVLYFSAANNPAYLIRKGEITEMEPVMNPVGIYPKEIPFKLQKYHLKKDDVIYMFTDGYADQFGGNNTKSKKFTIASFKKLLTKISEKALKEQKEILEKQFNEWQNVHPQIDDVLVFAVKY